MHVRIGYLLMKNYSGDEKKNQTKFFMLVSFSNPGRPKVPDFDMDDGLLMVNHIPETESTASGTRNTFSVYETVIAKSKADNSPSKKKNPAPSHIMSLITVSIAAHIPTIDPFKKEFSDYKKPSLQENTGEHSDTKDKKSSLAPDVVTSKEAVEDLSAKPVESAVKKELTINPEKINTTQPDADNSVPMWLFVFAIFIILSIFAAILGDIIYLNI
jgi:hypothetical protein